MVNTNDVEQVCVLLESPNPPCVAGLFVCLPVINRIAPQLTGRGIVIGRYACDLFGLKISVHLEQFGVLPDVGRVGRDVDRDITDDAHACAGSIGSQRRPLGKEHCLKEHAEVNLVLEFLAYGFQCLGLTVQDVGIRPFPQRCTLVLLFLERHKQRVILNPIGCALAECLHGFHDARHLLCTGISQSQKRIACGDQRDKVHLVGVPVLVGCLDLLFGQHAVCHQLVEVDHQRIACRCRVTLIGRITKSGMPKRQNLPITLACIAEKVNEIERRLPKRADTMRGRQRGDVHEHTARTVK